MYFFLLVDIFVMMYFVSTKCVLKDKSFGFSVYYQVASTSSAISMDSFPPLSIAPVQIETAPLAESTQAQSVVANQVTNFDIIESIPSICSICSICTI